MRMALGATRRDVVGLVVRQAAMPISIGLLVGISASFAATRVLSAQLFGVTASDPLTFVIVALGLGFVGLIASVVPARRAASVDPTQGAAHKLRSCSPRRLSHRLDVVVGRSPRTYFVIHSSSRRI